MRLYALSDLHLSLSVPGKSMDKFGILWQDHTEKIRTRWNSIVEENDIVLISGDISWAMHTKDAEQDLNFVASLNGRKVLLRGNHDFWWNSIGSLRRSLPEGCYAVQNDSVTIDGITIAGSRGWDIPNEESTAEDIKIYNREVIRLKMALDHSRRSGRPVIGMMHYPPFGEKNGSGFTELFEAYNVETVVYGHLHGATVKNIKERKINGVNYILTSCDALDFTPKMIMEI